MSTTIEVTGVQPSTITVGRDLGFDPIVAALDSAATKALIVHARPLAARAQAREALESLAADSLADVVAPIAAKLDRSQERERVEALALALDEAREALA